MNELASFVDAVLVDGKSINSQAKAAKVDVTTLRRLVLRDPRYAVAKAQGKIETKDFSTAEDLRNSPLVKDIVESGISIGEAAVKYGLTDVTVRNRLKKAYPSQYGKRKFTSFVKEAEENDANSSTPNAASPSEGPKSHGLLPLIAWETARDWNPAEGPIPRDQAEAWMAAARPHTPHSYILRVEDNGMTALPGAPRTFPVGCLIFVDAGRTEAKNGVRIIARVQGTNDLVFRIYHNDTSGEWLEPLNTMFQPIREPFVVVGQVFGKWEDA